MEEAIRQYVDLYRENRDAIDSHSARVLNEHREEACRILSGCRLPRKGSENYEITDLSAILGHNYGVNINRIPLPVNPMESFHCGVPKMTTALFMLINDIFAAPADSGKQLPEGVEAGSLMKYAGELPETVGRYYNKLADNQNPCVALSTLLAQDGIWIRISKGMKIERPLQIVNLLGGTDNLMAVRRIVIVAEEGSEVRILSCDHTSTPDARLLALQTIEIYAEANSSVHYYDMEESSETTARLSTLWVAQKADSRVDINGITLYNGATRNEYHCAFAAPGSSLRLYGMGIADKERLIDTYSRVDHDAPRCFTEELFKYSVDDAARASFTGLVKVAPGAEKTEAYQSNRNLIGSAEARMYSKPQLEIYNDDVKCSHGSATGQLDEMQLFYMRTRGLSEPTARLLLKQAFMADVINDVDIPGLRERLTHLVERRFAGEVAGCRDCSSECPVNRD
ncbi:MAG: Fe-S cluster assembly protein SufD [Muribaculaceae bacterium]|nr:Fe-S cluster assembly protein SufD [Muribaculaceae bacterium]